MLVVSQVLVGCGGCPSNRLYRSPQPIFAATYFRHSLFSTSTATCLAVSLEMWPFLGLAVKPFSLISEMVSPDHVPVRDFAWLPEKRAMLPCIRPDYWLLFKGFTFTLGVADTLWTLSSSECYQPLCDHTLKRGVVTCPGRVQQRVCRRVSGYVCIFQGGQPALRVNYENGLFVCFWLAWITRYKSTEYFPHPLPPASPNPTMSVLQCTLG